MTRSHTICNPCRYALQGMRRRVAPPVPSGGVVIVRIAGEGWWLLPDAAEPDVLQLDNAVTMAVDEAREDEYQRLLVGLCAFVREHGELLESHDHAGDADITVPPPSLSLDSVVDALFDAGGLSAE